MMGWGLKITGLGLGIVGASASLFCIFGTFSILISAPGMAKLFAIPVAGVALALAGAVIGIAIVLKEEW